MSRHISSAAQKKHEKWNRPPQGKSWVWFTLDMLESPAWRSMPLAARKVVERIAVEHMHHAGTENGNLIVTYDDFERFGIRRKSIKSAIETAAGLGWIDVTEKGRRSHGAANRRPSRYALTWLPCEGAPPTNRWKGISEQQADAIVARHSGAGASRCERPLPHLNSSGAHCEQTLPPGKILEVGAETPLGRFGGKLPMPSGENAPRIVALAPLGRGRKRH